MCNTHEPPRIPTVLAAVVDTDSVEATSVDTDGEASLGMVSHVEPSLDVNMVSRRLFAKR